MTEPALKVALLAREGEARVLLRRALVDLGAELVLEADPNTVDAGALAAARVRAVLFSVEPATEAALDRLDDALSDPALGVVFDEAETTAKLSGWDLNRWARHLAAKLLGSDLLPPAAAAEVAITRVQVVLDFDAVAESDADPPVDPAPPRRFDFSALELAPLDGEDTAPSAVTRLVLVLSGIGGPDAVRQLLRALPAGFPAAVLLRQSLDGGRHDRFVEQLVKISRLPVALASTHETPPPQAVRVLADGATVAGALHFVDGLDDLIAAVASSDGAVVVLSGAESTAIAPLCAALAEGLRVIVQDPAGCFEPATAEALRRAGAPVAAAADLAARLDTCFSH